MIEFIRGDCLDVLKRYPGRHFSAASFSPPYGTSRGEFDVRRDFGEDGRFLPYMIEICRVADVVAINLTQKVVDGALSAFTEEMTVALEKQDVTLFDRWVVAKPTAMPRRGNRALTNFEFVLLYTRLPHKVIEARETSSFRTVIDVRGHGASNVKALGTTPYFPEIPRQVFQMYGTSRVLDPFAGSGTSLRVAEQLGLDSVGVELNEDVYNATKETL